MFAANAGDNSVSSFGVGEDGTLTLLDVKRTGNIVTGRGGTAKSLAYAPSSGTLYVVPGDGTFRGLGGIVGAARTTCGCRQTAPTSTRSTRTPPKLVGYAVQPDGSLDEITSASIPYNSPQAWRDSERHHEHLHTHPERPHP
jgi:hypothetical protein